jgi:uncharacterized protein YidB (DUF937 family)
MAEEITNESIVEESPLQETTVQESQIEPSPEINIDPPDDDKGAQLKGVYTLLNSDKSYTEFVPSTYNEFVLTLAKDVNFAKGIHALIANDKDYSDYLPATFEETVQYFGLGKPSAAPSASVDGGSATRKSGVVQPSSSQRKETLGVEGIIAGYGKPKMNQVGVEQPKGPSEAEEAVMGYGLPKNIKIGAGKKKEAEEDLRLPTEAEFATIEKMPLTKEAKLEEAVRLGTPPVEKATKDIKSNKDKILSSEEELNKLEKELATYKQQSDSLLAIYENETLSPEDRNKAGQEYNKVNEIAKPIEDRRNELYGNYQGYIDNQKVLFNELDKAEKMRQKGLEKEYSSVKNLYEATASYSVKALTGLGKMSHMISSLIPNFGLMTPEEEQAGKMAFDESLGEINKFADGLITQEVPENYKKIFDGEFSAGKLAYVTSNAIASTIPTIAAGLLTGGAGSVMVGAGMGFDESKSIMKEAGLTDEQAEWAAFGVAIPMGFLEKYGADDAVRLLSGSKIRREVATELAKKFAGKTLTREAIYLETKKTFGELIKAKTAKLITSGGKESITEMTQGEIVEGVKQFVQEVTGVDKDENMSTQDYVMQQLSQRGEEGVGGFLGGTSMQGFGTAYSAIANKQEFSPSAYTKAMEFADPAKFQQFQNDLMLEVQNGVLTEEQANEAVANVQAIQETNALIPNSVQNLDLRTEAVNLIIEKNNIAKETEGKDPDLIAPENARLAEIKKALNDISLGKKPGAGEQKVKTLADEINVGDTVDLTPSAQPTTEEAPTQEQEAAPQTLPEVENEIANLREQEQAENEAIDPNDEVAKKEIYDKYDEAITPLLEKEKELKAEEAQAEAAPQEKGEFSIQGTFDGLRHVLGDPANMIPDVQRGDMKTTFSESNQNGKKIFTLNAPQTDDGGRLGYLSVSLVFPETTTKTMADVKAALEAKAAEAKAIVDTARDKGRNATTALKNKVSSEYTEQAQPTPATEAQAPVAEEAKATSTIDIKLDDDAKIEARMAEIEGDKSKQGEFDKMEKEMERRERSSVFDVPLSEVSSAIDALNQKEKDKPNGFGAFIEKRDARETKGVADKYLNAEEITDRELKRDFNDAVLGNPDTWYADGLKLRESINEATRRGINLQELIADVEQKFINDGFTLEDAKATIQRRLAPVFNGAEIVQENEPKSIEQQAPQAEAPVAEEAPKTNKAKSTTKEQIEEFGVEPEMVKPVNSVISKLFDGLKKAGFTTAKNVNEWLTIGKGKQKNNALNDAISSQLQDLSKKLGIDLGSPIDVDSKSLKRTVPKPLPEGTKPKSGFDLIKKKLGETVAKSIRQNMPYVLDYPNEFLKFLESKVPIKEDRAYFINEMPARLEALFRLENDKTVDVDSNDNKRSPEELAAEAGFVFYRPESEEDIVVFKKDFREGDILCTYGDVKGRIQRSFIFWIRKNGADTILPANELNDKYLSDNSEGAKLWREYLEKIGRKKSNGKYDLSKLETEREDPYGTSSMSVQINRYDGSISIKNRYNHRVRNPDATFGNDLNNIALGLENAVYDIEGVPDRLAVDGVLPPNSTADAKGKLFRYDFSIGGVYGDGAYISKYGYLKNGEITLIDRNTQMILDDYVFDLKNKTITTISSSREFLNGNYNSFSINQDKIEIKTNDGNITIGLEEGSPVTIEGNTTKIGNQFLMNVKTVTSVNLPNVTKIGNNFLAGSMMTRDVNLPNVKTIGNNFLSSSSMYLQKINLPNVTEIGFDFLRNGRLIKEVNLPNVEVIGSGFLSQNNNLKSINLPNVIELGYAFLMSNEVIDSVELPRVEIIENAFLLSSRSLKNISLPEVKSVGDDFMRYNEYIKSANLPNVKKIGNNFIASNTKLRKLNIPKDAKKGFNFMSNNIKYNNEKTIFNFVRDFFLNKEAGGTVKAQYSVSEGKNVIDAVEDFNEVENKAEAAVTLIHEIMHPAVVAIVDGAKDGNEVGTRHTQTIVDEFNKANPDSQVTADELIADNDAFKEGKTSEKYRAVQEFIAESWERYHLEGAKGFSKAFQNVLEQITKAFQSVYTSLTGRELTPELRQMFDELLGKQPTPTKATAPTSEQTPQAFPAQEGAEAEQKSDRVIDELEQIYRDLYAAVNKSIDPKTLEAVKRNPTLVMVEKALRELERKGVIKIDCK